jgi:MFS transporter, OFA family, oxalate/formate antiporter
VAEYGKGQPVAGALATTRNRGWVVTFAGTGINLALGVLYSWSVISQAIPKSWGWTEAEKSLPYSIATLVFAFATIPAGRLQDKIGPRWVAAAGGVLVSIGLLVCAFTTTNFFYIIGFGLLAGAGIGFGYASATPPAIKWFSKAKTGLIAGIVVSGFGLASAYIAPTANFLAGSVGLQTMMLIFAVAFLVVVFGLSQLLQSPPAGYVPPDDVVKPATGSRKSAVASKPAVAQPECGPGRMVRTWQFYVMWFMYFAGAGAGLMIISKMSKIATDQAGVTLGFLLVAILALGNGGGRIVAGIVSDKIGRTRTLLVFLVLQTVLILALSTATPGSFVANPFVLSICAALIGACYGSNLSVYPSCSKDWFGLRDFGANYGVLFTAWGVGGFVMSLIAGAVYDANHSFVIAYYVAAALLVVAAALTFVVNQPSVEPLGKGAAAVSRK